MFLPRANFVSLGAFFLRKRFHSTVLTARLAHRDEKLSSELLLQPEDENELETNLDISVPKLNALDVVNKGNIDYINHIKPTLKKSFNLAAYVNVSHTLQQLVKLNMDISKIDKYVDLASYIVRADFKADIEPYILLFLEYGVKIEEVGVVLNRNPFLLTIPLDVLKTRINYFLFKKFSKQDVASLFTKGADVFSLSTQIIDTRLGNLSNEYNLPAVQLRDLIRADPRIIRLTPLQVKACTFLFKEEMGFTRNEMQSILLQCPQLWRTFFIFNTRRIYQSVFDYVHNEMGIPHKFIAKHPYIFTCKHNLIKSRHLYLKALDRAQYDPTKPLFVPLNAFYDCDDAYFSVKYAKTSVNDFNAFLKTI